jgi:hypothetical protein
MQWERIGISITPKPSNAAPFAPRQIKNCDRQPHFSHRHIADGLRQDESHRHWAFRHESSRDNPQGGYIYSCYEANQIDWHALYPMPLSHYQAVSGKP